MANMMTVKEVSEATNMSQYAIRKGVISGMYPAIRVCGNPNGKILINFDEFVATIHGLAQANVVSGNIGTYSDGAIRRVAE